MLGIARYPIKFVLLAAFALPLLAAFAVRHLEGHTQVSIKHRKGVLVAGFAALAVMALIVWMARNHPYQAEMWSASDNARAVQLEWGAVWPNALARAGFLVAVLGTILFLPRLQRASSCAVLQMGLLAVLAADILTHTSPQNPTLPVEAFADDLRDAKDPNVLPKPGEGRVFISAGAEARLLYSESTNTLHDFLGKRLALWSNLNLLEQVAKVNGSSTLQLREQAEVQSLLYGTNKFGRGLIDFLGVSHFSSPQNPTSWVPRDGYCPLVTCGQQPIFAGNDVVLKALVAEDFDPRKIVFLSSEDRARVTVTNRTEARILSAKFSAQKLAMDVEAKEPSLVVVAQSFYHPWRAEVDGQPASLLRANHAFQSLEVPAGRHRVTLNYRDRKFFAGGLISLATLAACVIFWWRRSPADRKQSQDYDSARSSITPVAVSRAESEISF